MPLIRFENVGKIYKTGQVVYEALHDVNLEIEEGELVVILGPSGAGKSTLLNLLGGLDGAGIWIDSNFAERQGLTVGDELQLICDGIEYRHGRIYNERQSTAFRFLCYNSED